MNQRLRAAIPTMAAIVVSVSLGTFGTHAEPASPAAGRVQGQDTAWVEAVTEADTDLELAFTIPGRVTEVLVKPGDHVKADQALVRLDDREVQASVELLRLRAESNLDIEEATALLDLARNELAKVEQAHEKAAVSDYEVARARLDVKRREVALDKAKQDQAAARLQLQQAEATADRYVLRSPVAGTVETVTIEQGETVQELKPVVRVVSVDPLRVDAAAPLQATLGVNVGDPVEVAWAEPGESGTIGTGRVVYVASVADAASGTRLVRIRLANPGRTPAGARVKVSFTPRSGRSNPGSPASRPVE